MHREGEYTINLETERLLLRNILPSDKDFIITLWTDPGVTRFMGGPRDEVQLIQNIQENIDAPCKDEYDLWPVLEKAGGTPVGHCGLLEKDVEGKQEVEVVYVIAREYWGKGYAAEMARRLIDYAFEVKRLDRVIALIKPDNAASARVAEKCGMAFEKEVLRGENIRMRMFAKVL